MGTWNLSWAKDAFPLLVTKRSLQMTMKFSFCRDNTDCNLACHKIWNKKHQELSSNYLGLCVYNKKGALSTF